MIENMKWHNKDRITLEKWAHYESSYERVKSFLTIQNDCILLYCTHVAVMQNTPNYMYKVVHIQPMQTTIFHIGLPILVDYIDQFSNGTYIFAKSRSFYLEKPSAYIVHPSGDIVNNIQLGDCIAHIQIDSYDQIWIGYNSVNRENELGWTKKTAYGKNGILVFNTQGQIVWSADQLGIHHCFAMNIGLDEYYFYAKSSSNYIHLFQEHQYCTYECEERSIVQLMLSVENTLIIANDKGEIKRLIRDEFKYKTGQMIEMYSVDGQPLKGELLMRNNMIVCIDGPTIYRYETN